MMTTFRSTNSFSENYILYLALTTASDSNFLLRAAFPIEHQL